MSAFWFGVALGAAIAFPLGAYVGIAGLVWSVSRGPLADWNKRRDEMSARGDALRAEIDRQMDGVRYRPRTPSAAPSPPTSESVRVTLHEGTAPPKDRR